MKVVDILCSGVAGRARRLAIRWWFILSLNGLLVPAASAALQFDVFIGYDGVVRDANWFPVVCEVANDGPAFDGVCEFTSGQFSSGQTRRFRAELPTNTRKRFVIPAFGGGGRFAAWNARLKDERGKVRAEWNGLPVKRSLPARNFLLGAIPREFSGLPAFPDTRSNAAEGPLVSHLRPELFPDDPIALEGLDALYLNSEKAPDLKVGQVNALLAWLHNGGHLIVGVEQPGDVNGAPWLRDLLPCVLTGVTSRPMSS